MVDAAESEEKTEEADATADEGAEETKEDDPEEEVIGDDDDEELPELSKPILDAIGDNAEAKAAWDRHWKGVKKREKQFQEREAALATDEKGFQAYQSYGAAFADPEKAPAAFKHLKESLEKAYGYSLDTTEPIPAEDGTFQYDGKTFYSEGEVLLYQELQSLKNQKSETKEDPELEEIKAEVRARKESDAQKAWVKTHASSLIAKVSAKTGGWGITEEQILQVRKAEPDLLDKSPVEAMKRNFPDAYADWKAGQSKPKVKDMIDGGDAKGFTIPDDPLEFTAKHALMMEA